MDASDALVQHFLVQFVAMADDSWFHYPPHAMIPRRGLSRVQCEAKMALDLDHPVHWWPHAFPSDAEPSQSDWDSDSAAPIAKRTRRRKRHRDRGATGPVRGPPPSADDLAADILGGAAPVDPVEWVQD